MTIYTLVVAPNTCAYQQVFNDRTFITQNGAMQAQLQTGNRWNFVLGYSNVQGTRRYALENAIFSLQGRIHRLRVLPGTLGYVRRGALGGSPLLQGAHAAGATTLSIDGVTNVTGWLKAGDWLSIGNELKRVVADVNTSGGVGTIRIWPELHQAYADNQAINFATPSGVFYQADPVALNSSPYYAGDILYDSVVLNLIEDVLA
jgi:hypothetical protein